MIYAPQSPSAPVAEWISELPQKYVGTLYATVKPPALPAFEIKIHAWGQMCDGSDQATFVADELYNNMPLHGRGWKYISWRCVAADRHNDAPLHGLVPTKDRDCVKRDEEYMETTSGG